MPSLVVGGVTIKVAPGAITRDRIDNVDRGRAFDNSYKASQSGTPKRDFHFTTPPIPRETADMYEAALGQVAPQVCSGDILGGSENVALQSESFTTAPWTPNSTPVIVAWGTVGALALSTVTDDNAAGAEGYEQTITFTGNSVKALSLFVNQGSATSSAIRLHDSTAVVNRLLGILTWSGGLPVVAMTTGTYLGYETLTTVSGGVYRLKFATTSITASNSNELGLYVAADAALTGSFTGSLAMGGVQAENSSVPTSYVKTTTATIQTLSLSCCAEITGWQPIKAQGGLYVVGSFILHEV